MALTAAEILKQFRAELTTIYVEGDRLRVRRPNGVSEELRGEIEAHKAEIIAMLRTTDTTDIVYHRIWRGSQLLWDMEQAGKAGTPEYQRLKAGWEKLLRLFEHMEGTVCEHNQREVVA